MRMGWILRLILLLMLVELSTSVSSTSIREKGSQYSPQRPDDQEPTHLHLEKRVGSGPSSPTRSASSSSSSKGSASSHNGAARGSASSLSPERPRGPQNSPVLSPLSSPGSHSASPKSYKSQPSSPSSDEGMPQVVTVLSRPPKSKKWDPWFKKERTVVGPVTRDKTGRIMSPARQAQLPYRVRKTVFYGEEAKKWASTLRPSVLRSAQGQEREKERQKFRNRNRRARKEEAQAQAAAANQKGKQADTKSSSSESR